MNEYVYSGGRCDEVNIVFVYLSIIVILILLLFPCAHVSVSISQLVQNLSKADGCHLLATSCFSICMTNTEIMLDERQVSLTIPESISLQTNKQDSVTAPPVLYQMLSIL